MTGAQPGLKRPLKPRRCWWLLAVFVPLLLLIWLIHSITAPCGLLRLRLLNHITAAERAILSETQTALERSASQSDQRSAFYDADALQALTLSSKWAFNVWDEVCRVRIPNDGVAQKGKGLRAEMASRLVPVPVWPVSQPHTELELGGQDGEAAESHEGEEDKVRAQVLVFVMPSNLGQPDFVSTVLSLAAEPDAKYEYAYLCCIESSDAANRAGAEFFSTAAALWRSANLHDEASFNGAGSSLDVRDAFLCELHGRRVALSGQQLVWMRDLLQQRHFGATERVNRNK